MKLKFYLLAFFTLALFLNGKFGNTGLNVGDQAPDFKLKGVDGKMVSLADYEDAKGYIVIFTCNTCPYAIAYEDRIIALHNKYAPQGFPVVAVNPNDAKIQPGDSFEKMKMRAKEKGFPFPYVLDETQEITKTYGASRTPHVFVLDKSRTVKYIGAIDNNHKDAGAADKKYVEDAVDALMAGKKIETETTKAVGCGIKWREA